MLVWQQNASLKPFNTFGMEVSADWLVLIQDSGDLQELIRDARWQTLPRLILGGGSNILFTRDVEGVVAVIQTKGISTIEEKEDEILVEVQSGEVWHEWVTYCVKRGWGGLENLSLIPGSVGASPMQNIGAYGVEIKDVFVSLKALHIVTGAERVFYHEQCAFGYRESVFKRSEKDQWIIASVVFRLSKNPVLKMEYGDIKMRLAERNIDQPSIGDISEAVCTIRQSKLPDPRVLGNAGSFFKNPVIEKVLYQNLLVQYPAMPHYPVNDEHVKVPAGWLIEQAGWKGRKWETCAVHDRQALVLVNHAQAKGSEIWNLSSAIVEDVLKKFQIELEREVNVY